MNEEKHVPGSGTEEKQPNDGFEKANVADDYYLVDDPNKEVTTTIGDGEMHNKGLVGGGNTSDDTTFSEGTTSEQDEAEWHDSEG